MLQKPLRCRAIPRRKGLGVTSQGNIFLGNRLFAPYPEVIGGEPNRATVIAPA
jgi:hypothetical protein